MTGWLVKHHCDLPFGLDMPDDYSLQYLCECGQLWSRQGGGWTSNGKDPACLLVVRAIAEQWEPYVGGAR